ncbi:MAG: glutamine--fructose-6-phosphate transaminase (isomerizing) [Candidatus Aenigmatarchaeota archaeon]
MLFLKMCGIVGMVRERPFSVSDILAALKRLEYRGYDSWGIATADGVLQKGIGTMPSAFAQEASAKAAIAHTRWATHGGVTVANAHPHADCSGSLLVVHNGILENYKELKESLERIGHAFKSQTDTEVIAHFFEEKMKQGETIEESVPEFLKIAQGTFAILLMKKGGDRIYALKRDSPLAIGQLADGFVIASDIYAFSSMTDQAVWFENDEWAVITAGGCAFFDAQGRHTKKAWTSFIWPEVPAQVEYEHFMLKEIHDVPAAAKRLLMSLQGEQKGRMQKLMSMVSKARRTIFVASGTSYHASLLGVYFLSKAGIEAQTIIASEFKDYTFLDKRTLVIAISQSGETMDVIEALKIARGRGAKIASIVNVPYSTVQRMSDLSLEILAGQEVCVAATKSFVSQSLLLLALAEELGCKINGGVRAVAKDLEQVFAAEERIKQLAHELKDAHDIYILGRGLAYPISREIALKLKEISYIHAEGMMGGELKHGTLALIEPGVPVIGLVDNHEILSNLKEVEARGGNVVVLSDRPTEFPGIQLATSSNVSFALAATVAGQLLTYYIAKEKGLPIDKPRNLAKSVTVK